MLARLGLLAWALLCPLATSALGATEASVRASHLYHLTKFVEWPDEAFPGDRAPLEICVAAPADEALRALDGRSARGRTLRVRDRVDPAASETCQMLVFPDRGTDSGLAAVRPEGVLTIGEGEAFVRAGGMVGFVDEPGGVGFVVDPEATRGAGLRVSSKFLRLAHLIDAREVGAP